MAKQLTFITGNPGKADFLARHLNHPIKHHKLDLTEIQSLDLDEIIEHKTKEAYNHLKSPVLVEDTSLTFLSLGKLPGPLIKWFLEELGHEGLCKLLKGFQNRKALAEVCFGLYDGKRLQKFKTQKEGSIALKAKGTGGMGWDPIFIPKGSKQTWGQMDWNNMSEKELLRWSLRVPLYRELERYLKNEF